MKKFLLCIIILVSFIASSLFINNNTNNILKLVSYNGNNLRISIDGAASNTLPTSGIYYLVDYDCNNTNTKVTWNKNSYTLDVSNGTKKGDIVCYLEFKSQPLLSEMSTGSYVKYIGSNGCDDANIVNGYSSCSGKNANYVSDTDMGYCKSSDYKFYVNGWRIGYVEDSSVHLISAGAPECMCTDSSGTSSYIECSDYINSYSNIYNHYNNLDAVSLKYCNSEYATDGVCNSSTASSLNADDFKKITGKVLSSSSCSGKYSSVVCGWTNDLIENGGYYWYATAYGSTSYSSFYWNVKNRRVDYAYSFELIGVRPVLKLDSSVIVTGGSGTYTDPYTIDNNYFNINSDDLSAVELSLNSIEEDVTMCISVGTSVCTNYIDFSNTYTLDLSDQEDDEKIIYVYYKNSTGKVVATMNRSIILDATPPVINSFSISSGTQLNRTLNISCTGADYMCFSNDSSDVSNCTNWVDYAPTYNNWILSSGTGNKRVYAFFKDEAGNVSTTSASTSVKDNSSQV